jgi:putative tricarboxylic transport membrane protein
VPKLLAVVLAVLSVVVGARSLVAGESGANASDPGLLRHLRALGVAALGAAFVALAPVLGYPLALALLLLAAARYYGAALRLQVVLYAGGTAAILWLIFARGLGVAMPAGLFG